MRRFWCDKLDLFRCWSAGGMVGLAQRRLWWCCTVRMCFGLAMASSLDSAQRAWLAVVAVGSQCWWQTAVGMHHTMSSMHYKKTFFLWHLWWGKFLSYNVSKCDAKVPSIIKSGQSKLFLTRLLFLSHKGTNCCHKMVEGSILIGKKRRQPTTVPNPGLKVETLVLPQGWVFSYEVNWHLLLRCLRVYFWAV